MLHCSESNHARQDLGLAYRKPHGMTKLQCCIAVTPRFLPCTPVCHNPNVPQDLEQAKIEATAALEQAQEHQVIADKAQQAAQKAQSSISALQRQATAAETALEAATASWEAERATLEAAAAAASAEEVEQRVQAAVAGKSPQ